MGLNPKNAGAPAPSLVIMPMPTLSEMVAPLVGPDRLTKKASSNFDLVVAVDGDRNRLRIDVGAEAQRTGVRDVVAVGDRSIPVGRGEVEVECRRATGTRHRERRNLRKAAVAFRH